MAMKKKLKSPVKEGNPIITVIFVIIILAAAALALYPFIYMVAMSLIDTTTPKLNWSMVFDNPTLDNYVEAFVRNNFGRYFLNSAILAVYSVALNLIVCSAAAYAFAKKKFTGSKTLYMCYLATMMVPGQVTLIPTFLLLKWMGLLNTYTGMTLPTCGAFGVMLIYSFMKGVPDELLEAADLDGCSELHKFFGIVMPLIKSVLVSLAVFTFISAWGALTLPLIVATSPDMVTINLAIAQLKNSHTATNYGYMMAGTTIGLLPPLILYLFLQKQFVEGIALSGTKG